MKNFVSYKCPKCGIYRVYNGSMKTCIACGNKVHKLVVVSKREKR